MDQESRHNLAVAKVSVGAAVLPEAQGPFHQAVVGRANFLAMGELVPCFSEASRRGTLASFKGLARSGQALSERLPFKSRLKSQTIRNPNYICKIPSPVPCNIIMAYNHCHVPMRSQKTALLT